MDTAGSHSCASSTLYASEKPNTQVDGSLMISLVNLF